MPLIVDAYNVLHVTGVLPPDLAGIEVDDLVELVADSRFARQPVCLVCDGRRAGGDSAGEPHEPDDAETSVHVIYAGRGRTADDVILDMVRRSSIRRRLTVVTQDRPLAGEARKAGCRVMRSDTFLRRLAHDRARREGRGRRRRSKPSPPLTAGEVDAWLRYFGLNEDDPLGRPHEGGRDGDAVHEADQIDMDAIADEESPRGGFGPSVI